MNNKNKIEDMQANLSTLLADSESMSLRASQENRDLTDEEQVEWESKMTSIRSLKAQISSGEREEAIAKVKAEASQSTFRNKSIISGTGSEWRQDDYDAILKKWALGTGSKNYQLSPEVAHRSKNYGVDLTSDQIDISAPNTRQLSCNFSTRSVSGYTVGGVTTIPTLIGDVLERQLKYFAPIRSWGVRLLESANNTPLGISLRDNTNNYARVIVGSGNPTTGEGSDMGTATNATYSSNPFTCARFTTGIQPISLEVLSASQFNMSEVITQDLAELMGRGEDRAFVANPDSIAGLTPLTSCNSAFTGQHATSTTLAELQKLYFSVDRAYRDHPTAGWVMSDSTMAYICGLADTTGRPLVQSNLQSAVDGPMLMLLGKPIRISNNMPAWGTVSSKNILFGALGTYTIREIPSMAEFFRYEETLRKFGQIGFSYSKWQTGGYTSGNGVLAWTSAAS